MLSDQTLQHGVQIEDQGVEVDDLRFDHLAARKRQQLAGQAGGALRRFLNMMDVVRQAAVDRNLYLQQFRVAENSGEQVVEIMSDAACQTSDALQFPRLKQ